jgi:signal peptidase I
MEVHRSSSLSSEPRHQDQNSSTRWFWSLMIIGLSLLALLLWFVWDPYGKIITLQGKAFEIVSDSMNPTMQAGDKIFARYIEPPKVARGDVIVFRVKLPSGTQIYTMRVIGLPGETVELRNGFVFINGKLVPQTLIAENGNMDGPDQGSMGREIAEQLPGKKTPHRILDLGFRFDADDFPPVLIPSDHLFVLGDNRDRAADSRFSADVNGVGLLARSQIVGKVENIYASKTPKRVGIKVN